MSCEIRDKIWNCWYEKKSPCDTCDLYKHHISFAPVFGLGNCKASVWLIGENPGVRTENWGKPFIDSGKPIPTDFLDYKKSLQNALFFESGYDGGDFFKKIIPGLMKGLNWTIEDFYFTQVVKCSEPENNHLRIQNVFRKSCHSFLDDELREHPPSKICLFGTVVANEIIQRYGSVRINSIKEVHGKLLHLEKEPLKDTIGIPFLHPNHRPKDWEPSKYNYSSKEYIESIMNAIKT